MHYCIHVLAEAENVERIDLGTVSVEASSRDEAKDKAYEELWDARLDSASCFPVFELRIEGEQESH